MPSRIHLPYDKGPQVFVVTATAPCSSQTVFWPWPDRWSADTVTVALYFGLQPILLLFWLVGCSTDKFQLLMYAISHSLLSTSTIITICTCMYQICLATNLVIFSCILYRHFPCYELLKL